MSITIDKLHVDHTMTIEAAKSLAKQLSVEAKELGDTSDFYKAEIVSEEHDIAKIALFDEEGFVGHL